MLPPNTAASRVMPSWRRQRREHLDDVADVILGKAEP
jgi:hypothetical protein